MTGPFEQPPVSQAEFEAMMRRWLMKVGARYVPVTAIALAVALVLIFVPTKQPSNSNVSVGNNLGNTNTTSGSGTSGPSGAVASGGSTPTGSAATQTASSPSGGGATGTGGGGATQTVANSTGSHSTSGPTAIQPRLEAAGSSGGVATTGAHCGNGARQFAWSTKAPLCVAAWSGNNGGATAPGVTPTTITLTYRLANSAQQSAIDALAGAANINQTDYVDDMQSYVNFFNKQFELYGRHVVLKTFQGTGDYIEEDQGQDLEATQADAETAHSMGAFGDVTFSLESSQYYEQDLAAEHLIGFSSVGLSQAWFQQYAPYEYSDQGANGTTSTAAAAYLACQRMNGMNAIYAGETALTLQKRKFGVIYPQTPIYQSEVNQWESTMQQECGIKVASTYGYAINIANYETEATEAIAAMRASGVTTILCACDPIVLIFLTDSAGPDSQQYYPEWFSADFGDPVGRDYQQQEWDHAIVGGPQYPPIETTEAYKAFEAGYPGKHPAEWHADGVAPYFPEAYYTLLQVFDALQAAGPDLTPYTFEQGEFSLPESTGNDPVGGVWKFGNDVFDPVYSYNISWWSTSYISQFDDTAGGYEACNAGATYVGPKPSNLGGPDVQLQCFGK